MNKSLLVAFEHTVELSLASWNQEGQDRLETVEIVEEEERRANTEVAGIAPG